MSEYCHYHRGHQYQSSLANLQKISLNGIDGNSRRFSTTTFAVCQLPDNSSIFTFRNISNRFATRRIPGILGISDVVAGPMPQRCFGVVIISTAA